jgi:hypothetical protein
VIYALATVGLVLILLILSGGWRLAFSVFKIPRSRMTIERLGLIVKSPEATERVAGVLTHFAGGFNAMITRPSRRGWERYCDGLPVYYRPFAQEGAAMGHTLRRLFRCDPTVFEAQVVNRRPECRYLHYVGLGFWSGMRNHSPQHLMRVVNGLDALHGSLCYDGYGFKYGFFDYLKDPGCHNRFKLFEGYARNVAYQGLGRSFWFLFMEDHEDLIEHIGRLGDYAPDTAAGLGLAAVFVYPDRLDVAQAVGAQLPAEWHDDFHLGVCFGLKARLLNDPNQFDDDLSRMDAGTREAARASIRACDRTENRIRSERVPDAYRCWREEVAQWMADHIAYPLAGMKAAVRDRTGYAPMSA